VDHDDLDCDVVKAVKAWQDMVAVQEEHSEELALVFEDTQERAGWVNHQRCIIPVIDASAQEVMDARTPAEAYLLVRSALCQVSLICFILGRQHEGAEV
jgi:hypothetical protein